VTQDSGSGQRGGNVSLHIRSLPRLGWSEARSSALAEAIDKRSPSTIRPYGGRLVTSAKRSRCVCAHPTVFGFSSYYLPVAEECQPERTG